MRKRMYSLFGIAFVGMAIFIQTVYAQEQAGEPLSTVPVSIGVQELSSSAVAQVQMKYYSVSVSGRYKSSDGAATYTTTKTYSIRAGSSSEARDEAVRRFYSEFYQAYDVTARVLN